MHGCLGQMPANGGAVCSGESAVDTARPHCKIAEVHKQQRAPNLNFFRVCPGWVHFCFLEAAFLRAVPNEFSLLSSIAVSNHFRQHFLRWVPMVVAELFRSSDSSPNVSRVVGNQ
eukprot:1795072-Amphidinium_carterae.1